VTAPDPAIVAAVDAAVLARNAGPETAAGEKPFTCPEGALHEHGDAHPSARWNHRKAVWRCDVCKSSGGVKDLARRLNVEIPKGGRGGSTPRRTAATAQPQAASGCTLAAYAQAKRLPVDFLRGLGLIEVAYLGAPAVRIPYRRRDGKEIAVRFRVQLAKAKDGPDGRFRWRKGSKPTLYGLDSIGEATRAGSVALVEGESDAQTLRFHGIPSIGLPGATNWREDRDVPHFDGIGKILVTIEPDSGGDAVLAWLAKSKIRDRVHLVTLPNVKDPSAMYLDEPARFRERWGEAVQAAVPWERYEADRRDGTRLDAWRKCQRIAKAPRILDIFAEAIARTGLVGEGKVVRLLFLVLVSRFLARPVSVAVKGPSSGGKSFLVERVLAFVPPRCYYALSAMSERALAYSEEPLSHRFLVLYEACGLQGDFASYLVRSLLSEGRVRYETVEKVEGKLQARLIEREGPTGLLLTTTAIRLHPENETRLLSLTVTDTPEQTAAVLSGLAAEIRNEPDLWEWHSLQDWLDAGETRVVIPFASTLAQMIPPVAVRLRRDFTAILNLIQSHAILHQATRVKDDAGRIVATLEDYAVVRNLVASLVADGVEATVPATVRETVETTRGLIADISVGPAEVTKATIARALKLDKGSGARRVDAAIADNYLKNLEDKPGRPSRIILGDPMPEDAPILPSPDELGARLHGCTGNGGDRPPPPPSSAKPVGREARVL